MARARVWTTCRAGSGARVEQLCVGVEQRQQQGQGLRSVTPSPHAAGAQRLTQGLRSPTLVPHYQITSWQFFRRFERFGAVRRQAGRGFLQ